MQRRDFIRLISGVVVWPLAARAQQPERPRRIGVLLPASQSDSEYPGLVEAFLRDGCLKTSVNDSDFLDCSEALRSVAFGGLDWPHCRGLSFVTAFIFILRLPLQSK